MIDAGRADHSGDALLLLADVATYGNLIIAGVGLGAVYALFGLGITLIYKATRVPNFAHAAVGMVGAYVFFKTWDHATANPGHRLQQPGIQEKIPFTHLGFSVTPPQLPLALALLVSLLATALVGLTVERLVLRRLGNAPTLTMIIVTTALLAVITGLAGDLFGQDSDPVNSVFGQGDTIVAGFRVQHDSIGLLVVTLVLAVGLTIFFKSTDLGIAVRATADSREVSRLLGISADRVAGFAWAVGSMMAGVAGVLISPRTQLSSFGLATLVVFGFTASLLGGFSSLYLTLAGGILLGVVGQLVQGSPWPNGVISDTLSSGGAPTFVTLLVVIGILLLRPPFIFKGVRMDEDTGVAFGKLGRGVQPEDRVRKSLDHAGALQLLLHDWRNGRWILAASLVGGALVVPAFLTPYWSTVLCFGVVYALVSLSIITLTGWTGQLSLAPLTFLGVGAFMAARLSEVSWFHWYLVVPMCGATAVALALLLGLPALRLRGFFLALATLAFAAAGADWLFTLPPVQDHQDVHRHGFFPGSVFRETRGVYYAALIVAVVLFVAARNLQKSRVVRAWHALRDSETTAVAFGVNPVSYKLLSFAFAGFIGGAAGAILGYLTPTVQANVFAFTFSLAWVLQAVVGGVTALSGAIVAGVLFQVLPQLTAQKAGGGVNQAPFILGGLAAISTVTDYPNGLATFWRRMFRPFEAGERLAWASDAAGAPPTVEDPEVEDLLEGHLHHQAIGAPTDAAFAR